MDDTNTNVKKIIQLSKEGLSEAMISKIITNPEMENMIRATSATAILESELKDLGATLAQLEEKTTWTHTEVVLRIQLRRRIAEVQQQIAD